MIYGTENPPSSIGFLEVTGGHVIVEDMSEDATDESFFVIEDEHVFNLEDME